MQTAGTNGTTVPEETVQAQAPHEPKAEKKAKKVKIAIDKAKEAKYLRFDTATEDVKKLVVAKDEDDPFWDARLNLDIDEGLVESMADESEPATIKVVEQADGTYKVWDGRSRVRALPDANRLRKKAGKAPIVLTLAVCEPVSDEPGEIIKGSIRANIRVDSPPTVLAMDVSRALAADVAEDWLCRHLKMTSGKLHEYLALLDLPKSIQKHVDDGTISIKAALALTKLDEKEVEAAAEKLAQAAKVGKKVTTGDVVKKSDADEKVATKKEIRQYVLDIQSDPFAGKHGQAVVKGMILMAEVCLGFRSIKQATAAGARAARGEEVKLDLKQFQSDGK